MLTAFLSSRAKPIFLHSADSKNESPTLRAVRNPDSPARLDIAGDKQRQGESQTLSR